MPSAMASAMDALGAGSFEETFCLEQLRLAHAARDLRALDSLWSMTSSKQTARYLFEHDFATIALLILVNEGAGESDDARSRALELTLGALANAASHRTAEGRTLWRFAAVHGDDGATSRSLAAAVARLFQTSLDVPILAQCARLSSAVVSSSAQEDCAHPWTTQWANDTASERGAITESSAKLLFLIASARDEALVRGCFTLVSAVAWAEPRNARCVVRELLEMMNAEGEGEGGGGWRALERSALLGDALRVVARCLGDDGVAAPESLAWALLPPEGPLHSHLVAWLRDVWCRARREEHAIEAATLLWRARVGGAALRRGATGDDLAMVPRIVALLPLAYEPRSRDSTPIVALLELGAALLAAEVAAEAAAVEAEATLPGSPRRGILLAAPDLAEWAAREGVKAECGATRRALARFIDAALGVLASCRCDERVLGTATTAIARLKSVRRHAALPRGAKVEK